MRRLRDESGAVAIVMALLVCFVMIPMAALAVDLGVQRVARRDMQSLADVVALDLSRRLDGRTAAQLSTAWGCTDAAATPCSASATNDIGRSAARNTTTVGSTPTVTAQLGCLDSAGAFVAGTASPCTTTPNAVRVVADATVDFAIAGGSGGVSRTAIGQAHSTACFRLGSFAAQLNTGNSALAGLLNGLLGVNLNLASYQGLAAATVNLADLAADSHIGSVDTLLNGNVSYQNLALAALQVVSANQPSNTVAIKALGDLVSASSTVTTAVALGSSVLSMGTTDTAALDTEFSVLDILAGSVLAASSAGYGIDASHLQAQVPGLGNVANSSLKITQRPQLACGRAGATAKANQVSGAIALSAFQSNSVNLPGPGPTLKTGTANATINVNLGNAQGVLSTPVVCGAHTTANPDRIPINVSGDAATVSLAASVPQSGSLTSSLTIGLNLYTVEITGLAFSVNLGTTVGANGPTPVTLTIPPNDNTPATTGSPLALPAYNTANVTVDASQARVNITLLGLPISGGNNALLAPILNGTSGLASGLVAGVTSLVNSATSTLAGSITSTMSGIVTNVNAFLDPLSQALGIRIGGADVFAVKYPVCNAAGLVG